MPRPGRWSRPWPRRRAIEAAGDPAAVAAGEAECRKSNVLIGRNSRSRRPRPPGQRLYRAAKPRLCRDHREFWLRRENPRRLPNEARPLPYPGRFANGRPHRPCSVECRRAPGSRWRSFPDRCRTDR